MTALSFRIANESTLLAVIDEPATVPPTPGQPASSASSPDDRATSFQPVEGGGETRSGEVLLVEAYVFLWIILLGWIAMLWRKQGAVNSRLDALEKEIDRAAQKAGR